ncbi:hypothetical protein ACSQ67_019454 [Phaseolus vulgaris]
MPIPLNTPLLELGPAANLDDSPVEKESQSRFDTKQGLVSKNWADMVQEDEETPLEAKKCEEESVQTSRELGSPLKNPSMTAKKSSRAGPSRSI